MVRLLDLNIKFANDVTLTKMGAAFDGITIEGAKLNGTFTVNANDVTLKNLNCRHCNSS